MAWERPSDRAEPTLEWLMQHIAQKSQGEEVGERQRWHNRRVPVEILAAEEEIRRSVTLLVTNEEGMACEKHPTRGLIYEAMVWAGLDWLDDALPRYDRRRELEEAPDDSNYYPHDVSYRWARNPHFCHREEGLSVWLPVRTLSRASKRAEEAHLPSHVLVLGTMVAGIARSEVWLPRRGPQASRAISHWLDSIRKAL